MIYLFSTNSKVPYSPVPVLLEFRTYAFLFILYVVINTFLKVDMMIFTLMNCRNVKVII